MLQAYQVVLPRHGIIAAEDTYYYRMIITLSLRPESDWWDRLEAEHCMSLAANGMIDPSSPSQESKVALASPPWHHDEVSCRLNNFGNINHLETIE
jgi:hypothetical protein